MKSFMEYIEENPDFLNNYLKYERLINHCSKTTVNEIYFDIRTFFRYIIFVRECEPMKEYYKFKEISIKEITLDDLRKINATTITSFTSFLKNALGNCAKTRNRKLASLKTFFKYLSNNSLLSENLFENIEFAKVEKRNPKFLNLTQSKKLLSTIINSDSKNYVRDYAMVCIFLNCCLRLNELVMINLDDINIDEKTIKVLGKGNKERIVYMNDSVIEALQSYLKVRQNLGKTNPDRNALFLSEKNARISRRDVQYTITKYLENSFKVNEDDKPDIKGIHTHTLRHTGATLMYDVNDTNILILQKILGHSLLSSTEIYTHVSNKKLKEIMETCGVSSLIAKFGGEA